MSGLPSIVPPSPYAGLWLIYKGEQFIGWMTFFGWQPRYLLAGDEEYAHDINFWLREQRFANLMTGPLRKYRVVEVRL